MAAGESSRRKKTQKTKTSLSTVLPAHPNPPSVPAASLGSCAVSAVRRALHPHRHPALCVPREAQYRAPRWTQSILRLFLAQQITTQAGPLASGGVNTQPVYESICSLCKTSPHFSPIKKTHHKQLPKRCSPFWKGKVILSASPA